MQPEVLEVSEETGNQKEPLAPPLKWAGGKRWLLPTLQPLWARSLQKQPGYRLVEPFCGGLAVALGLRPQRAWLNDVNPHLVSFYQYVQQGVDLLATGVTFENNRTHYDAARARFNQLIEAGQANSAEAAALFYYLNRTGFNGLCRFNRRGFYNVPFGRYAHIGYQARWEAYRLAMTPDWTFTCGDFEALEVEASDWVYADPPYDVEFVDYASQGFNWQAQERLAHWLGRLPGPVVASNQATPRVLALYEGLGFHLQKLQAPRRIACTGDRRPATEMLAWRNLA